MRRVVAVIVAMLLLLPAGVASGQSPAPEATSLFAPDDIGFTIPSVIGPMELEIEDLDMAASLSDPEVRERYRDLLMPLGKEPSDVSAAIGRGLTDEYDAWVTVVAFRIAGVPSDGIMEALVIEVLRVDLADPPPGASAEWQDVHGRRVLVLEDAGFDEYAVLYPKGEVLYIFEALGVAIEDVVAALP